MGPGFEGNGGIIWTNIWVPTLIPEIFFTRLFLCDFSVVREREKNVVAAEDISSVKEKDSIDQYGRNENLRIFGVDDEPCENVFAKVMSVAEVTLLH